MIIRFITYKTSINFGLCFLSFLPKFPMELAKFLCMRSFKTPNELETKAFTHCVGVWQVFFSIVWIGSTKRAHTVYLLSKERIVGLCSRKTLMLLKNHHEEKKEMGPIRKHGGFTAG